MKKIEQLKFLALAVVIIIFFSSTGIKCLKEKEVVANTPDKTNPTITKTPVTSTVPTKNPTATPINKVYSPMEQAAVDAAKNFATFYTNYKFGDFSNWDLMNGKLTEAYQNAITAWVAQKKKDSKVQPIKYINYYGVVKKAELMKIDESKAEVKVEVEQEEVFGALSSRTNPAGPTSVWVDENGTETSFEKIQRKIYTKTFYVFLAKEEGIWKVDSISVLN